MSNSTKVRIILLVVILLTLAMEISGDTLTELEFTVIIHGRPCQVVITQVETMYLDPEADAPRYSTVWICEVVELDNDAPTPTPIPTMSPTVSPTITPGPTQEPPSGGYASLKTSSVFHKATCRYVVNRLPSELDIYATCDIAFASGKRPCKSCDPCE